MSPSNSASSAPTAAAIHEILQDLQPQHIDLVNESMNHAGYFAGKESHFKLTIVSDAFTAKRLVARHQLVYQLVDKLLTSQGGNVHALAIHAYTPDEWQAQGGSPDSPSCAGQNEG
ncbi:BolA family protein [Psychrobacter sp. CAL346-MNA-CIBAN-0220]|uniref:BolA family protein n=1 Tax=Psychrobacter sp. CAL346-MNA-CIBAN-0220 TaxID=3140457 RepID=UPI0033299CD0